MILIVDSGSTKTDWIALDKNGVELFSTQTLGLNPQMLSNDEDSPIPTWNELPPPLPIDKIDSSMGNGRSFFRAHSIICFFSL